VEVVVVVFGVRETQVDIQMVVVAVVEVGEVPKQQEALVLLGIVQ